MVFAIIKQFKSFNVSKNHHIYVLLNSDNFSNNTWFLGERDFYLYFLRS